MLLPAIGKTLIHSPIAVQIFAAGALGNIAFQRLGRTRRSKANRDGGSALSSASRTTIDTSSVGNAVEEFYEVDSDFDESEYVEEDYGGRGGFGRPSPKRRNRATQDYESYSDDDHDDGDGDGDDSNDDASVDMEEERAAQVSSKRRKNKGKKKQGSLWGGRNDRSAASNKSERFHSTPSDNSAGAKFASAKKQFQFFGRGKQTLVLEVSRLHDQVENLTKHAVTADNTRQQLESDCDTAVQQVR
jgi:hypothetical protein